MQCFPVLLVVLLLKLDDDYMVVMKETAYHPKSTSLLTCNQFQYLKDDRLLGFIWKALQTSGTFGGGTLALYMLSG